MVVYLIEVVGQVEGYYYFFVGVFGVFIDYLYYCVYLFIEGIVVFIGL